MKVWKEMWEMGNSTRIKKINKTNLWLFYSEMLRRLLQGGALTVGFVTNDTIPCTFVSNF